MRFLLSNDDGYLAHGLATLARALAPLGHIDVVAPERDRSGASNSLTLDVPLRVYEAEPGVYFVIGTPTDCVLMAFNEIMKDCKPTLVLSGINRGANLAEDVTYSGTIAAAMEGTLLGVRSIAIVRSTAARYRSGSKLRRTVKRKFSTPVRSPNGV